MSYTQEEKTALENYNKGKLDLVRNLLDILDTQTIASKADLSIEEVRDLREEMQIYYEGPDDFWTNSFKRLLWLNHAKGFITGSLKMTYESKGFTKEEISTYDDNINRDTSDFGMVIDDDDITLLHIEVRKKIVIAYLDTFNDETLASALDFTYLEIEAIRAKAKIKLDDEKASDRYKSFLKGYNKKYG